MRARMIGDAAIAAQIGTRLYPVLIPQDAELPAIAYQVISAPRRYSHSGDSRLTPLRMQFTIQANSYDEVTQLSQAVRQCWSGFHDAIDGVQITAFVENEFDIGTSVRRVDVILNHNEA